MAEPLTPIQEARAVVDEIVKALHKESFQSEVGIKVAEPFVGGSIGQGTAVNGHYDLDLVLYSRELKYDEAVEHGYDELLAKIQEYLARELSPHYTYIQKSYVAITFKYKKLKVDFLLSPFWKNEEDYLRDMAQTNPMKRLMFSVSRSKNQTEFVKGHPMRVRELIRRAKAWRNVTWDDSEGGKPKSYLMTLLIIIAYGRVTTINDYYKEAKFKDLAEEVGKEMIRLVTEIASTKDLDLFVPGTKRSVSNSDLLPDRPRIVDPVNPVNNVYLSGLTRVRGRDKWSVFKDKVASFDITITAEKIMEDVEE